MWIALIGLYLENFGDLTGFHDRLASGQRMGQAFFNSLDTGDQSMLVGTLSDPFHDNGNIGSAVTRLYTARGI